MKICIRTYIFLSLMKSVCIILLVCIFSRLANKYWTTNWSSLGKITSPISNLPWLLIFLYIGLSPHGCFSHLFRQVLWCTCSDIIWAVMLMRLHGNSFWHYQERQPHRKLQYLLFSLCLMEKFRACLKSWVDYFVRLYILR